MTSTLHLQPLVDSLIQDVLHLDENAELARQHEISAAIRIQKHWRGFTVRRNLSDLAAKVLVIQRCFRGLVGRNMARFRREELNRSLRQAYFDLAATEIQRHWRGYQSRRLILDLEQRRHFLQTVARQNRRIRIEAQQELENALVQSSQQREAATQQMLTKSLAKMHHLISTRAQMSSLRSPILTSLGLESTASIHGRPVEDVIRSTARSAASTSRSTKRLAPVPAPYIVGERQTLRTIEPYGWYDQHVRVLENAANRTATTMHAGQQFVHWRRAAPLAVAPPLHAQTSYTDPINYTLKGTRRIEPGKNVSPQRFYSTVRREEAFDKSLLSGA